MFGDPWLRVPYRVVLEDYDEEQYNYIKLHLDELGSYTNGCIEWYDDTITQLYPAKERLISYWSIL